jgi:hypothetical protein
MTQNTHSSTTWSRIVTTYTPIVFISQYAPHFLDRFHPSRITTTIITRILELGVVLLVLEPFSVSQEE